MPTGRFATKFAGLALTLLVAMPALAETVQVTRFREGVQHYNKAVEVLESAAPLNDSSKCWAVHEALEEYRLAIDLFQGAMGGNTLEDFKIISKAHQRAVDERHQLFQVSYRLNC